MCCVGLDVTPDYLINTLHVYITDNVPRWGCCGRDDAGGPELLQQPAGDPPGQGRDAVHQGNPDDGRLRHGVLHSKGKTSRNNANSK